MNSSAIVSPLQSSCWKLYVIVTLVKGKNGKIGHEGPHEWINSSLKGLGSSEKIEQMSSSERLNSALFLHTLTFSLIPHNFHREWWSRKSSPDATSLFLNFLISWTLRNKFQLIINYLFLDIVIATQNEPQYQPL